MPKGEARKKRHTHVRENKEEKEAIRKKEIAIDKKRGYEGQRA